jgi:hypothetical protein
MRRGSSFDDLLLFSFGSALLAGIVGRRDKDVFGIWVPFADDLDVVGFLPFAFDQTIGEDNHNPKHPQEDADTASKDECHSTTFPRTERHESMMKAP